MLGFGLLGLSPTQRGRGSCADALTYSSTAADVLCASHQRRPRSSVCVVFAEIHVCGVCRDSGFLGLGSASAPLGLRFQAAGACHRVGAKWFGGLLMWEQSISNLCIHCVECKCSFCKRMLWSCLKLVLSCCHFTVLYAGQPPICLPALNSRDGMHCQCVHASTVSNITAHVQLYSCHDDRCNTDATPVMVAAVTPTTRYTPRVGNIVTVTMI